MLQCYGEQYSDDSVAQKKLNKAKEKIANKLRTISLIIEYSNFSDKNKKELIKFSKELMDKFNYIYIA
jgi:hypothetical protein